MDGSPTTRDLDCTDAAHPQSLVIQFLPEASLRDRLLELGAGNGRNLCYMKSRGYQVVAVECHDAPGKIHFSDQLCTSPQSRDRFTAAGITLLESDMRRLTFAEEEFRVIVAIRSLNFLGGDLPAMCDRMHSWLAPGGRLILSFLTRAIDLPNPLTKPIIFTDAEPAVRLDHLEQWFTAYRILHLGEVWVGVPPLMDQTRSRVLSILDFVAEKV